MGVDAIVLCKTGRTFTDDELAALNWSFTEALGRHNGYTFPDAPKMLGRIEKHEDDSGSWGTPADLEVNWGMRFYGPGYERGCWPTIYAVARWFWARFPGCSVYYGGDSGETIAELTPEVAEAMWAHWAAFGGAPYRAFFGASRGPAPRCCAGDCINTGCGGGYDRWQCPVCGKQWDTKPGQEPKLVDPSPHPGPGA